MTRDIARKIAGLAAVLFIVAAAAATSSAGSPSQHEHSSPPAAVDQSPGAVVAPGMMAMRQQMQAEHRASDERLRLVVERMNVASGEARIDAMAAVVVELVAERATMRAHMDGMPAMPEMMHGPRSDSGKMSEQCPMMKTPAAAARR
jgi:hypothetical protein